ncbi:MFS transporter [uncultured Alsobacter sp.]|uniref:MFS transporter n=1 Tax=uncultured Alsobacter sp. TaxID=1748258 RepID=UPI0025ED2A4D|nr:MFS transporter [uncultured Alsobacter sp.]
MQADRFRRFGVYGGGVFFTITGLSGQFFTLYAQELGASTLSIGLLVTLRAVLPIFIAMPSGQLIDSIGPMKMLIVGAVSLLASLILNATAAGIVSLVLSQFFLGASIIIMASAFQVLVSTGDVQTRNEYIQKYSMWMSGGGMLGPLLGGLVASAFQAPMDGYRAAFLTAAVSCAGLLVALLWLSRSYPHPDDKAADVPLEDILSVRGVFASYRRGMDLTGHRPVQFGLTATFLIMYIQSLYNGFLPLYMDSVGYTTMLISVALALNGLASMAARYILKGLMDRLPAEYILTGAGFVAATCVLVTPITGLHVVSMMATVIVMGGAVGLNLPLSIMIMVDAVGETERGKLMGLRLLVNRVSQMLSPAMFGVLGHLFGLSVALYGGGAFLLATMFGFSAYANRTRSLRGS